MGDSKVYLIRYRLSSYVGSGKYFLNYRELCHFIENNPKDPFCGQLINRLTNHFSYFFREPEHFYFLQRYLLKRQGQNHRFHFWSAACSTGQEAYSIAMAIEMAVPQLASSILIDASDISKDTVRTAQSGIYKKSTVDESLPEDIRREFFYEEKENYRIVSPIADRVVFQELNLMKNYPFPYTFDIIFLRNVLYYLNIENRNIILKKIIRQIRSGGFLVLGKMDTYLSPSSEWRAVGNNVYKVL